MVHEYISPLAGKDSYPELTNTGILPLYSASALALIHPGGQTGSAYPLQRSEASRHQLHEFSFFYLEKGTEHFQAHVPLEHTVRETASKLHGSGYATQHTLQLQYWLHFPDDLTHK